jgi:mannose/fructose/N-acetylgalactosamine-specific phosphotransferase system component IIC
MGVCVWCVCIGVCSVCSVYSVCVGWYDGGIYMGCVYECVYMGVWDIGGV